MGQFALGFDETQWPVPSDPTAAPPAMEGILHHIQHRRTT